MKSLILGLMVVSLMACASPGKYQPLDISGVWKIEAIGSQEVIKDSPADISFLKDGSFAGNASCNRYFGSYELSGDALTMDERIGSTMMMCAEPLMEQEQRLLKLLPTAQKVTREYDVLLLLDGAGHQVLRASRVK